jgi:glycosyltransferase involved in cell wall biosynthesis
LCRFGGSGGELPAIRAKLSIPPGVPVIGTVGRLVPVKGQQYLLDALPRVLACCPEARLLIVGDGPLGDSLRRRALDLGVARSVHFTGLREDIPELMGAMDLFCLPSLNEGMGRVLVEAMASRLAVVATRVSGVPDVVQEGVTGLLVPPRDAPSLAAAVIALLQDPARARQMGEHGRRRVVPAFGVAAMLNKLEGLYHILLSEAAPLERRRCKRPRPPKGRGFSPFPTGPWLRWGTARRFPGASHPRSHC